MRAMRGGVGGGERGGEREREREREREKGRERERRENDIQTQQGVENTQEIPTIHPVNHPHFEHVFYFHIQPIRLTLIGHSIS